MDFCQLSDVFARAARIAWAIGELTGNAQVSANERYSRLAGAYGPILAGSTIYGLTCAANPQRRQPVHVVRERRLQREPADAARLGGPASNDAVTLEFKQSIGANDALRTGAYGKTLTFTLSATMP